MNDLVDRITENINALVDSSVHREPLSPMAAALHRTSVYEHRHPSLLNQLRHAVHPGTSDDEPVLRSACASRPPASEDALDALIRIESAAAWWLATEFKHSLRGTAEANLRALVGEATRPIWTTDQIQDLAADTSSWVAIAKVETGWIERALTIPDPCPAPICATSRHRLNGPQCHDHTDTPDPCPPTTCARTRSIRVHRDGEYARCTTCGTAWSQHHLDLPSVLLLVEAITTQRDAA